MTYDTQRATRTLHFAANPASLWQNPHELALFEEGRLKALRALRQLEIQALVVIGGIGSQTGACALSQLEFPVVGVASTIDNDLAGSEITIGVDTALNIALEAIDWLKVTARPTSAPSWSR